MLYFISRVILKYRFVKNFLFTLLAFFCLTSHYTFSQDTINKSSECGFYVKNGVNKTLITELGCYTFDELSVTFPLIPEMQVYLYRNTCMMTEDGHRDSVK